MLPLQTGGETCLFIKGPDIYINGLSPKHLKIYTTKGKYLKNNNQNSFRANSCWKILDSAENYAQLKHNTVSFQTSEK